MGKPPLPIYLGMGAGFQGAVYSLGPFLSARTDQRLGWQGGRPGCWNRMGLALIGAGAAFIGWAVVGHFRAAPQGTGLTARPDYLATGGAYGVSRNPLYVGGLTMWAGWTVFFGSRRAAVVGTGLAAAQASVGVPFEERMLADKFGDAYADYRRRVPRWL